MKYLRDRVLILICLAAAPAAFGNFNDVPAYQPPWRGSAGSTVQKWSFLSTPTNFNNDAIGYYGPEVTTNSAGSNPNGLPTASIIADQGGVGWFYGDSSSVSQVSASNFGWWDLGFNAGGSITLAIPNAPGPSGAIRYIWIQVTEATNTGHYLAPTVAVTGGTQIGTAQTTTIEHYSPGGIDDDVAVSQTIWQIPANSNSYTITITGASGLQSDSFVGGIVVDTGAQPPVANNVTYTRATNLTWKIKASDLATNGTPSYNGDTLSVVSVSNSTNGTVSMFTGGTNGTFVGFVPTNNLTGSFTYTVQDNQVGLQASALVTLNVVAQQAAQAQITNTGGQVTVSFAGIPGYTYDIQRADNVNFIPFTVLETTNAPAAGLFIYVDPSPPNPAFYRLKPH